MPRKEESFVPFYKLPDDIAAIRDILKTNLWLKLSWFSRRMSEFKIYMEDGFEYIDTNQVAATQNIIFGIPAAPPSVSSVSCYYAQRNLPATWWLPSDIGTPASWWLTENGWAIENIVIGLALHQPADLQPENWSAPEELTIVPCSTLEHVKDLGLILESGFMPDNAREGNLIFNACLQSGAGILNGEGGWRSLIAYANGAPAACLNMLHNDGAVGFYDITAHAAHKGKGYERAVFFQALRAALDSGAGLITLQAAEDDIKFYLSMGFCAVTQFILWNNNNCAS